jgi:hypothetical protein
VKRPTCRSRAAVNATSAAFLRPRFVLPPQA